MAEVKYQGNVVNSAISEIASISSQIPFLSSSMKSATNKIVSARGFQQYVGGITSDSFSVGIDGCGDLVNKFINDIRQKQVKILSYSQDEGDINAFLNTLSRSDYDKLDLSELDSYIGLDRKVDNFFSGFGSTIFSFGMGLVEGVGTLLETGADLVVLAGTGVASLVTGAQDILLGTHATEEMWENTKAYVSEKHVQNAFDHFYADTDIGRTIKNNAYYHDIARGLGSGLGYTAGMIGLSAVTGGLASGLGIGASGSIGAGQLAATAGVLGFSRGTQDAWADGADIGKGLLYGAATGAWEGAQWFAGAKINQINGLGDKIAQGIFKGAAKGVGIRIGLDTIDSALEGFVQPALTMIYKDYGQGSFAENYNTAFQAAGGWMNVGTQAFMGAVASAVGEKMGARRLLKEANAKEDFASKRIFEGQGGIGDELESSTLRNNRELTIDGDWVRDENTVFNTRTSSKLPSEYQWFSDGTYLPSRDVLTKSGIGSLNGYEIAVSPDSVIELINSYRQTMTATDYKKLMEVANVFKSTGSDLTINELKLIAFHSEGNIGRIKSALTMTHPSMSMESVDSLSEQLANKLFNSKINGSSYSVRNLIMNDHISQLQKTQKDLWLSSSRIIRNLDGDELVRLANMYGQNIDQKVMILDSCYGGKVSSNVLNQIANSDGYASTIRKILANNGVSDEALLDQFSAYGAARAFSLENLARIKATSSALDFDFDSALRLASNSNDVNVRYRDLMKATGSYGSGIDENRMSYYSYIEKLMGDGVSKKEAILRAKQMNTEVLTDIGSKVQAFDNTRSQMLFNWNDGLLGSDNSPVSTGVASNFVKRNYLNANGNVDEGRIISDFEKMMRRKINAITPTSIAKENDFTKTLQANSKYLDSFLTAANDSNNPNKSEVVRVMAKLLELDDKNSITLGVRVINDSGNNVSQSYYNIINLFNSTIDNGDNGTIFHETGHHIYRNSYNEHLSSSFASISDRSFKNTDSPDIQQLIKLVQQNNNEAEAYATYTAKRELYKHVRNMGYSGIDAYRQSLIKEFDNTFPWQRGNKLAVESSTDGLITKRTFENKLRNRLDFKNTTSLADIEINTRIAKIHDRIMRKTFPQFVTISGMIDTTTQGYIRLGYGHGTNYFGSRGKNAALYTMHELVADYTALKLTGDNRSIRFLRKILGNELMNEVDLVYQAMLR